MSVINIKLPKFFVYRHVRVDTYEVFYIGKGNNIDVRFKPYRRAYISSGRTSHWRNIVFKNGGVFGVDILWECDTEKEINEKEKEFIKLYGRIDLGEGTLINLTDGGEGMQGTIFSADSVAKRSGKNHYHYAGLMEKYKQEKLIKSENKKVINVETKEVFKNITEASCKTGISIRNISRYLNGTRPNKSCLCYLSDYNKGNINIKQPNHLGKGKKVVDTATGVQYKSVTEAAGSVGYSIVTMYKKLEGKLINNTNLRYA